MARVPRAGRCKTRLCPPLGHEEAAALYTAFLHDLARELPDWGSPWDLWVAWTDDEAGAAPVDESPPPELARVFAPPAWRFLRQAGASLAERLDSVFTALFAHGYRHVVARNSDSPHLPASLHDEAFAALDAGPGRVVLGPDLDGGYYLVGLDAPRPGLFPTVMSTSLVLEETLAAAREGGLLPVTLAPFLDVDSGDDLAAFWLEFGGRADVRHWETWRLLADGVILARLEEMP
jgi:glycosyltransferase A (GT-A) superfamily protein (DUF2064 family)